MDVRIAKNTIRRGGVTDLSPSTRINYYQGLNLMILDNAQEKTIPTSTISDKPMFS